ncbi:MAG: 5'-nucleotidase C-terminal domain-containing protein [Gemmatimonadota bacterium]
MRHVLSLSVFGAIALGLAACADDPAQPEAVTSAVEGQAAKHSNQQVRYVLTVLHNNDGESELLPDGDVAGVARFASVIDRIRDEVRVDGRHGLVVVSSGDNFLAGPQLTASIDQGPPFFDAIALNQIGYDAFAIGNHEFDLGPDFFADFIAGFSGRTCVAAPGVRKGQTGGSGPSSGRHNVPCAGPFLSSNLDVSGEPALAALEGGGRIAESIVVQLPGARVGVIGATTPNLPFISSPRNVVVEADVAAAIMAEVGALEASGVDKIILASHLQSVQEELTLIPMLDGVDIVIAGGGDELLANPGDLLIPGDSPEGDYPLTALDMDGTEVPVVTTAGQYRYVGRLVVEFDHHGDVVGIGDASGPVRVVGGAFADGVAPDPVIQSLVVAPVEAAVAALAATIIGTSEVDLDGRRSEVRTRETNQGNLIADALLWQAQQLAASFGAPAPDVALQNGGGIRNDEIVPAGPISLLKTFEMVPFPNFVTIVADIPREQFKEILENAVSRVEFTDGRFAQIAGFTFSYDTTGTAQILDGSGNVTTPGTRVVDVTLSGGTPIVVGGSVQGGAAIAIATIDFLARGGDQYPYRGAPFTTLGVSYQQALEDYIVTGLAGTITGAAYPVGGSGRTTSLP